MTNRGKKFETVIKESFEKVDGVSIDRIHDQTTRYKGSTNISDFIVYRKPYEWYIECKSVIGNTLSIYSPNSLRKYGNITNAQWEGMLEKSKIYGVWAGVICWWIEKDVTIYMPISALENMRNLGIKSVRWDDPDPRFIRLTGTKKRVFFEYDMSEFFNEVERRAYGK